MNTIKELYAYRQMIFSLVKKDLRGRYKGSVLGFLWTFINPLFQLIVYTMVFSFILKSNIERYYLYLFVALIPWIFFSSSITVGAASVVAQKDLVKKIYFPRMVIPISYVTSCFVNMLLCFIVIFAVIVITGVGVNFLALFALPVIMVVEYILALGMAMLTSAVTVYFRDLDSSGETSAGIQHKPNDSRYRMLQVSPLRQAVPGSFVAAFRNGSRNILPADRLSCFQ